jgi:hypothetical protein
MNINGESFRLKDRRKALGFLFFEGEWELADKRLIARLEQSRTTGNRLRELEIVLDLARLHRFTGEHEEAVQFLRSGVSCYH